ncbi:amino acid/polyamine/organocation transporter (APC superfamily) [Halopolyspora algeriensis]|uniref:Amino acid/polyamine/organocation transporter (APC superfamily) n=1 Tax=Halopolyspora algeriensis TaxID=1500506 RepID=A0A368VQP6_9ACTN|nr:APC family permease [Halopolyspora algeriensis]RCW43980.1 amino acid/polyamine/organocation transporter (APC superfamily) [Halopolyspora algeriensis]TQM53517.1 amino acid/polyamine/organocation transporter (APC superfamily) [Halopolyspora algeriensis]
MSKLAIAAKRLLVGRPFRSDRLPRTRLPKRLALPVFASDAMSSVAYAPEEIFLVLSVAGLSAYTLTPWIGALVALVMLTVVASYRQNVRAYPSGGGDYEVATVNLGRRAGLTVASALLVDYVLTVAVSISSAAATIGAVVPFVASHRTAFAVMAIVVLTAINLRGVRESGGFMAIPTYAFLVGILGMIGFGLFRALVLDETMRAESASVEIQAEPGQAAGLAFAFLVMRSFSQGAAALTGVEAISNGVPAFRKPKPRNAANTLLMMGLISVTMLMGLIFLARITGVRLAENPAEQIVDAPPGYEQGTMVAQIAGAVFDVFPPAVYYVTIATAVILILAANTAYNGFPVLGSVLSQDRYLPRQFHTRGDRLAFSNGIVSLTIFAILLVIAFRAQVTQLVQLYVVGVFVSFTLSQLGMLRHWNRHLRTVTDPPERRRVRRSQAINGFGLIMSGSVLVIVLLTKFLEGAWIAIAAMAAGYALMTAIRRHYDRVSRELHKRDIPAVLPSRNYAIVLVSQVHLPTLRALAYARATRPDTLEAITVNVDDEDTRALRTAWEAEDLPVPLKVVESPYREITRPVVEYVKRIRRESPRDVVTVFIPEYVVGHWWEQLLHNQSALRLKSRLLFEPGVMVTSVPWQLESSTRVDLRTPAPRRSVRWGLSQDEKGNGRR